MKTLVPSYRRLSHHLRPAPCHPRPGDLALLPAIHELADSYASQPDSHLTRTTDELRDRLRAGVPLLSREILVPCFAVAHEAVRRTEGMVYFDVQLLAGMALATGAIAEMKTGEGKTLVAALPASLHALTGEGVHVATVNSYLAQRDFDLMRRPLEMLGLTVGLSTEQSPPAEKRQAYACDVTYSTGYELGFDFLRDQATLRSRRVPLLGESFREALRGLNRDESTTVQRGHAFAIVDEVDSVLIDEANTPLILSHSDSQQSTGPTVYGQAAAVADRLQQPQDFRIDRQRKSLQLTANGQRQVYDDEASVPRTGLCRPWSVYVEQALRARHVLQQDVDYVVQEDRVLLVDQYTGRIFPDRNWRDGLHQAVEQDAGVPTTPEKHSIARVSRQRYFGLYRSLCGMSGTCTGHERELREFYNLPVVVIPERLPNQRQQLPTRYFATPDSKWDAIVMDVELRHQRRQPILVGTRTIDESNQLARRLQGSGIRFELLNGRQDRDEAELVASAGQVAAVTIATNMAGRGTDIKLAADSERLGGLHVIATQRQESARVDRQLVGRSARQGQTGSCQFFVSAEDELFQQYGPQEGQRLAAACQAGQETSLELDRLTSRVQQRAERHTMESRYELFRQDQWLNEVLMTVAETKTQEMATA